MSTANALLLPIGGHLVALDLFEDTALLPTLQANDRTKPDSIQSSYSPEFEVPASAHNHRLLRHAAASQPAPGQAYVRLPCVLTSGGVEILPLGLLLVKGFKQGRYQLQLVGGNKLFVEALGDKKLSDLDLSRFDHYWTPRDIAARLGAPYWQNFGWGYELYDRGKAFDVQALDPYLCYPSVAALLVLEQLIADAGFTANSLRMEPLAAQLNVPAANAYEFPQDYRDARRLQAGYFYGTSNYYHNEGFDAERLLFSYTSRKPYASPDVRTGASYNFGEYTVATLGYYDVAAPITAYLGCNKLQPGRVRAKFMLKLNGQAIFDNDGNELGKDELETGEYVTHNFNPKLSRYLLKPGDKLTLMWEGTEIRTLNARPDQPVWNIGPYGSQTPLPGGQLTLANEVQFTVTLLPEFPQGGLVRLADWLPDMKQLDFFKAMMLTLGLTVQSDAYEPRLKLTPGSKLLANVPKAKDWTRKRDAYTRPGRLPERDLSFRFGDYARANYLKWAEDERVTPGYGDGTITVADEVLQAENELATLPFAATEPSTNQPGLLQIINFEVQDAAASPPTYSAVQAKPRLTLRSPDAILTGQLVITPAVGKPGDGNYQAPVLEAFIMGTSYFAGAVLSLDLNNTVLGVYWADLRAMLQESRYLVERYRLTPQDISELDYTIPIWDGYLGDFFAVSKVEEFDARRSVQVTLCRLNAAHLPEPKIPDEGVEWYTEGEFYPGEFY
jgi:hypothetical protein